MKKKIKIKEKQTKFFQGKIKIRYRAYRDYDAKLAPKDNFNIQIYSAEISETIETDSEFYKKNKSDTGSGVLDIENTHIEKPHDALKTIVFNEDLENVIIYNYTFSSFKSEGLKYGIIEGYACFYIEYFLEKLVYADPVIRKTKIKKMKVKKAPITMSPFSDWFPKILAIIAFVILISPLIIILIKFWKETFVIISLIAAFGFFIHLTKLGRALFQILKFAFVAFITIMAISFLFISILFIDFSPDKSKSDVDNTSDIVEEYDIDKDSLLQYKFSTTLKWYDYEKNYYQAKIKIDTSYFNSARKNRSSFLSFTGNWTEIYKNLIETDNIYMKNVIKEYKRIRKKHKLSDRQFADVIVSSIQHVPYTWILNTECEDPRFAAKIASSGYECMGDVMMYGIQSPYEFITNKKGDCDTKTVFLYIILKHFKYDAVVLISNQYEHALLGVNLPGKGSYKTYLGKKYYLWETTFKDWRLGVAPPTMNNMSLWRVAI